MINENTLNVLNTIAFGADIDKLESHILDCKHAKYVSDLSLYKYNYNILYDILQELKPESQVFSDKTSITETEQDKYDILLQKYKNQKSNVYYEIKKMYTEELNKYRDKTIDICALTNIIGLDISCTYINGYVYKIYLISDEAKYTDLTSMLKNKMKAYIEEISNFELVDFRGKITIFNSNEELQRKSINIPCSVAHCLRLNINIDKLELVYNNMFVSVEHTLFDNEWDKIEYMREIGIAVDNHAFIRNVDKEMFNQAIEELEDYFEELKDVTYKYNGILLRVNDTGEQTIYDSKNVGIQSIFTSTIKSIIQIYLDKKIVHKVSIVEVKCNNKLFIDNIIIEDICDIDEAEIYTGNRIKFFINNGEAVLFKGE